jgi:hypothetical protein
MDRGNLFARIPTSHVVAEIGIRVGFSESADVVYRNPSRVRWIIPRPCNVGPTCTNDPNGLRTKVAETQS